MHAFNDATLTLWEWVDGIRKKDSQEFHKIFANLMWSIWKARNDLVFSRHQKTNEECLVLAKSVDWKRTVQPMEESRSRVIPVQCEEGQTKIQCDAAIGVEGGVAYGVVIPDEEGENGLCRYLNSEADIQPEMGEGNAVLEGLKLAVEMGIQDLVVETDCLPLFRKLKRRELDLSYMGFILDEIRKLCSQFSRVVFSWTPREGNYRANRLAKYALVQKCNSVYTGPLPAFVLFDD